MKVDPNGHWYIDMQVYGKQKVLLLQYENIKSLSTLKAVAGAVPFGGYGVDAAEWLSRKMVAAIDSELTDYYRYKPSKSAIDARKLSSTGNDALGIASSYLSSPIAKNILKSSTGLLSTAFAAKDFTQGIKRADKDNFIYGMIRAAGLESYLSDMSDPDDLYLAMTFIESTLDSYGSENNIKLYNKYFGSSYWGISDDVYGISWWDELTGNADEKLEEINNAQDILQNTADKLKSDFEVKIK